MNTRVRLAAGALLTTAFLIAGCKPTNPNAPARVTGKVTYNGSAVPGGRVRFHAKDTGAVIAEVGIASGGVYSATDIPEGEMVVTVETESVNPDQKIPEYRGGSGGAAAAARVGGGGAAVPKGKGMTLGPIPEGAKTGGNVYVKIPAKYADPSTSGLSINLKKGEQTFNIDLTD